MGVRASYRAVEWSSGHTIAVPYVTICRKSGSQTTARTARHTVDKTYGHIVRSFRYGQRLQQRRGPVVSTDGVRLEQSQQFAYR